MKCCLSFVAVPISYIITHNVNNSTLYLNVTLLFDNNRKKAKEKYEQKNNRLRTKLES